MWINGQRSTMKRSLKRVARVSLILAVLWQWAQPADAVEEGKSSHTAEAVCAFRAVGAQDPDLKTRNPDHMAMDFVNPVLMHNFPGIGMEYADAKIAMDNMGIGVFYWINARTHHMDALLTRALNNGIRQVVIMGAGFDSRAYRFHDAYPEVRFFEIDLPATSIDKQQRVEKLLGRRPGWVTYVSIDFNTQTLDDVLGKAGFAADQKTFYLWEGVTYYISGAGVDNTLCYIGENAAPGSQIVFDYMLEDVVQGRDYSAYGARQSAYVVALNGEPYIFGIAPQHLEAYINLRGIDMLSDLGSKELTRKYLIHSDGTVSGKMAEFLRIVHARIPVRQQRQKLIRSSKMMENQEKAGCAPESKDHRIDVPNDVQALLDGHTRCLVRKDFGALMGHFSKKYLYKGAGREAAVAYIQGLHGNRPVNPFKFVLTRFDRTGDTAKIDGFVQLKGYRVPIPEPAIDIVKEVDGRWRWYGDQQ